MIIINNFKIAVNKNEVIKAVNAYFDLNNYEDIDTVYNNMEDLARDCITPFGAFEINDIPEKLNSPLLQNCSSLISCILTVGDKITDAIEELFRLNKFNEAIILDAISTSILFNLSKQIYNEIYEFSKERNMGLTCRIAPGDGEIDISYQKDIAEIFINLKEFKVNLINEFIIRPYKTLTYVYGADTNININREDHKCSRCPNENCFMRNSTEKIRGSFAEENLS